jgi:hypothetical protein
MKRLPGLDYEIRSPKFNFKRPKGKTDDKIQVDVENKVIQMIGNYTHKEWEAAQKILKHQGRVNCVLEEMKVPCPPRPKPIEPCKKMQPPGNTGSELVETSKKGKAGKAVVTIESSSKLAKASEALAQWKAEAAKTTLPPVATKPSKLMKVSEFNSVEDKGRKSSGHREREKKVHEMVPATVLEKKTTPKRKTPERS